MDAPRYPAAETQFDAPIAPQFPQSAFYAGAGFVPGAGPACVVPYATDVSHGTVSTSELRAYYEDRDEFWPAYQI
jgi:hypothetical protein